MTTFTAWLRQQLRQERLSCRTLARRCGLTATQIRLAVAQAAPPSAHAVRRLARYFGAAETTTLRLAAEQFAATTIAQTDAERELVCALYIMPPARVRQFNRALAAGVYQSQAQALAAAQG